MALPQPLRPLVPLLALVALLACVPCGPGARAEDPPAIEVPDVRHQRLAVAQLRLEGAGLSVGRIWRMSWRRVADDYGMEVPIGSVAFQKPAGGVRRARGHAVDLIVAAPSDGPLPDRVPPPTVRREPAGEEPAAADAAPGDGAPEDPAAPDATGPAPTVPAAPVTPAVPEDGTLPDTGDIATGSPEAPAPAPPPNAQIVPPLLGLDLAVAEQLARDCDMSLHVERVPGHPVGRVLRQFPEPYEARPARGLIKVVVTAGGDFEGETAPPPSVHVDEVDVPALLDRTGAQALRILKDLRLIGRVREAERGPPGRIVDQKPRPRERVAVGTIVEVWVAPGDPNKSATTPPPDVLPPDTPAPVVEGPAPSGTPGGTAVTNAAPRPIAPAAGTAMPREATFDLGFTWAAVAGADGYLLEIDEQTADGAWVGVARARAKRTAELVTIERLDPRSPRPLRWRVAALSAGRPGPFCAWTTLP